MIILIFTLFSFFHSGFSINSCEDKLQKKIWPVDCFLALTNKKEDKNSTAYALLDNWCVVYQDDLVLNEPPEALFSLYIPENCSKLAYRSKKHHQSLRVLNGSFLNSFL